MNWIPTYLRLLGSALLMFTSSQHAWSARPEHPNVIIILLDDFGWADLGSYGSTFHRSPNIDRLATQGMRFTDAYAAGPVCSPTRASIMTGRYPARLHLTDWLPGRRDLPNQRLARPTIRQALTLEETTIPEALKPAGYVSAHIGKWHLGGQGHTPENQGFDVNIAGDHTGTPLSYFAPFQRQGRQMPGLEKAPPGEYLTDRLNAEAIRFIRDHRDRPFFLHLSHYAVHIPLAAPDELVRKYTGPVGPHEKQTNAIYAAMIESVDRGVGEILKELSSLQLAENTVIFFTSDNGGLSVREGPNTPATSNAPLRTGKGYLYEGGTRVPLIARWPGKVAAGSTCSIPVSSVDLFPTILELAGLKPANPAAIDGVSILPVLRGGSLPHRDLFWHYPHYSNQGGHPGAAIRSGTWKLIEFYESNQLELYDLATDFGETRNLRGQFPDRAEALHRSLAAWREKVGAQMMTANPGYKGANP